MVLKVQEYWATFTDKVDSMVENALRFNIKHSMEKLFKAISGDSKTLPKPLFKVDVALDLGAHETTPKVPATPHNPNGSCYRVLFVYMSTYADLYARHMKWCVLTDVGNIKLDFLILTQTHTHTQFRTSEYAVCS